MSHLLHKLSFVGLLAGLPITSWAQTILVSYTFEDTTSAIVGPLLSTVSWNSGGAEAYTSPFTSQGRALSVGNFQNGEYFQITLDTTGYGDVVLNPFRTNGSASAPKDWKISYSLTGISGAFVDAGIYTLASNTAAETTTVASFLLPPGAGDNSSLVLRLIATSSTRVDGNAGIASGTVRLDNLSFSATAIAVPEPATYAALAGLAALGFCVGQRRRRQAARITGQ
jgi:hypothetical protein